jgi:hypothetical protein
MGSKKLTVQRQNKGILKVVLQALVGRCIHRLENEYF